MRITLRQANTAASEIGHLHAHGLGSQSLDREEARTIRRVLCSPAQTTPVVAAKGHFGNAGAGSAALELAASLLAMKQGRLFAIRNCDEPDPDCPIRLVVSNDVEAGSSFLNLSFSPHGQASCVLVKKAA